jgi:TatD-related deoxyribonuclease
LTQVPILDNHIHLQPQGRNLEAVKEFQKAGGTHLILSHMPYDQVQVHDIKDFELSYEITTGMADRCNRETAVKVFCTVGPYPVLLLPLAEEHGLSKAKEIMMGAMEAAAGLVREGKAVAIGEVGRPHFPVAEEVMAVSNEILSHGMRLCKEVGCAIVIHSESATPGTLADLASMADRVGLDRGKVVKHFCAPLVTAEENHGVMPSVLASKSAFAEALGKGHRFLLETDFMDDPTRPGAVLGISTVPKRIKTLLTGGEAQQDIAWRISKDNPERVYGIKID